MVQRAYNYVENNDSPPNNNIPEPVCNFMICRLHALGKSMADSGSCDGKTLEVIRSMIVQVDDGVKQLIDNDSRVLRHSHTKYFKLFSV